MKRMIKGLKCKYLLILLLVIIPSERLLSGAEKIYSIQAQWITHPIWIDGRLEAAEWALVKPEQQFTQCEPKELAAPSERTEFRILYDSKNLYIGVSCFDSQPDEIIATEMRRDGDLFKNDMVMLVFDTFYDHRNAFYFSINPLGAKVDGIVTDEGKDVNRDWNGVWMCATLCDSSGWHAELEIPFSTLRFQKSDKQCWGFNIVRKIRRKNEYVSWTPILRSYGFTPYFKISRLGTITGFKNLCQQQAIQVTPYLLSGVERKFAPSAKTPTGDVGIDFKYNITSNLVADITWNTDFAQVEADEVQVNLSRFSLFFPEKRDFLLEGAGIFKFGESSQDGDGRFPTLLFFSRQIGLAEGKALPILGGLKLSGKLAGTHIGLLNMQVQQADAFDEDENTTAIVPSTNFSVVRFKRDVLEKSTIGFIFTNKAVGVEPGILNRISGDPNVYISEDFENRYNRTIGADFHFAFFHNFNADGFIARSFSPGITTDDLAYNSKISWRSDLFGFDLQHMNIQSGFNPELGFVSFPDEVTRKNFLNLSFSPRPNIPYIRKSYIFCENTWYFNPQNKLISGETLLGNFNVLEDGGVVFYAYSRGSERIMGTDEFEIRENKFVLPGYYGGNNFMFGLMTDASRMVAVEGFAGQFGFYSGNIRSADVEITCTPNHHLSLAVNYGVNRISDLDVYALDLSRSESIGFTTHLIRGRINYSFNPRLFIRSLLQWNSDEEQLSANVLLNYIYRPCSNLYLVYNEFREDREEATSVIAHSSLRSVTFSDFKRLLYRSLQKHFRHPPQITKVFSPGMARECKNGLIFLMSRWFVPFSRSANWNLSLRIEAFYFRDAAHDRAVSFFACH
ncbi:carbohydrate binding family 9 domain-containing protein [candidate division KSB1 bacterium]|nr:carbohydrate binding family 9 domain-containing protein [candidate division KSB1 bacterium]